MKINRIAAIMLRQFYLMRGSLSRVLPLFVWIGIDMVLWGFISRYLNTMMTGSFNFVPVFLGSVLMWDFFARVMMGVTMGFFEDVWSRNFLNMFATPIRISEYVIGLVLTSIVTSSLGLGVMLILARYVFGLSFLSYGVYLVPFLAVLFLCGIALGVFASAMVLRLGPAAEWFIWPIPALLAPFTCVFYPRAVLPHWMRAISRILPPSYVFEGLRNLVHQIPISQTELIVSLILSVLYVGLASTYFVHIYRYAVRSGLIARYSAESVS